MEKIGLQAVFETDDFKKGVKEYEGGLKSLDDWNGKTEQTIKSLSGQFEKLDTKLKQTHAEAKKMSDAAMQSKAGLDNMGQGLQKLTGVNTGKITQIKEGLEQIAKGFKQFTGFDIGGLVTSIGGLAGAGAVIFGAVKGFQALNDAVAPIAEKAIAVNNFADATQVSVEQASALIEVADDVGIEMGTLEAAAKAMVNQGLLPTISTIGDLAEQYQALPPGIERSQFAAKNLGRQWETLLPLMKLTKEQIANMAQGAEDAGIIIDDKLVASSLRWRDANDRLGDSLAGLKQQFIENTDLIDFVASAANLAADAFAEQGRRAEQMSEGMMPAISSGAELATQLDRINQAEKEALMDQHLQYQAMLKGIEDQAGTTADAIGAVATAILDMTQKAIAASAVSTLGKAFEAGTITADQYYASLYGLGTEFLGWTEQQIDASAAMTIANKAVQEGVLSYDEYSDVVENVTDAIGDSTDATERYNLAYEDYLSMRLEDPKATREAALQMGLYQLQAAGANAELDDIAVNLGVVKQGINNLPPEADVDMENLISRSGVAASNATEINNMLRGLPYYTASYVDIFETHYVTTIGGNAGGAGGRGTQYGGSVSPGMPTMVGERRPEMFVPYSSGFIFPSAAAFVNALGKGGTTNNTTNFNLNMTAHNVNARTVQDSYEMMRLLS